MQSIVRKPSNDGKESDDEERVHIENTSLLAHYFLLVYILTTYIYERIRTIANKLTILSAVVIILNVNAICQNNIPLHENTYVQKSKQWKGLRNLKI